MPAASEQTWRPLGVRMVGIAGGLFLLGAFVALWLLLPASVRADFDLFQRLTAITLGILIAVAWWALVRCRVTASDEGLVVVNGYKVYEYEWAQIISIKLLRGAPWAVLDLSDGTTRSVIALQATDGQRAIDAVRAIRRHLS
ncbi:PH domain-containing protein [Nocardioides sp. Bht2]|uniref:PH domain-containing protein n=1 Tax=Nocardioides sp. Bht2 TaxID=3392297 RepID=UPI0039B67238